MRRKGLIAVILDSTFFKIVAGVAFLLGMHWQNVVEISEVKGTIQTEMKQQRLEMNSEHDQKYVGRDIFKIVIDDIKEIKIMVKELVQENRGVK